MKHLVKTILTATMFTCAVGSAVALPLWMHGKGEEQRAMLTGDLARGMSMYSTESSVGRLAKRVIQSLVKGKTKNIHLLFSTNTLKEVPNLKQDLSYMLNLFQGNFTYWGSVGFSTEMESEFGTHGNTTCKGFYRVRTDEQEYEMLLMCFKPSESEPEDQGIRALRFVPVEDIETQSEAINYEYHDGIIELINERDNPETFKPVPGLYIPDTRDTDASDAIDRFAAILPALQKGDKAAVEGFFSAMARSTWVNKDEEMEGVFNLLKGEVMSTQLKSVTRDNVKLDNISFDVIKQIFSVLTDKDEYLLYILQLDSLNANINGLHTIRVLRASDHDALFTAWSRMRTGAYVPKGIFDKSYK